MNKNTYIFARLFIKLAILLAIIAVLGGIAFAINEFASMQRELERVKYMPSPNLANAAIELEKSYLGTNRRILRSLDIDNFPSNIQIVDFKKQTATIQTLNDVGLGKNYLTLARTSLDSINQIKEYHIFEFVKALQALQKTLNDQAAKLKADYASTNLSAGDSQPKSSAQQEPTPVKASFRIYADAPDSDKKRLNSIKRAKEFLEDLSSQSKKEESLNQIRKASLYLARAESLLDILDQSELPPREQENAESPGSEQEETETLIAKSERIASLLKLAIQSIQDEIYRNWTVELQARELVELAQDDLEKAREAHYRAEEIRNNAFRSIASSLLMAIGFAFLIMVAADFMRAFLNLSNNSDTLVS